MAATPVFGRSDSSDEVMDERNRDPIAFRIAGHNVVTDEWLEYEFHARGSVPTGSLMSFVASYNESEEAQTVAFLDFLFRSLVSSDRGRWRAVLDDEEVEFQAEMIGEIVDWLVKEWTGRPLRSVSASRAGASSVGTTSKAASPGGGSRASRPSRSVGG